MVRHPWRIEYDETGSRGRTLIEAHFVKGLLEAKGIASVVRYEDMIGGCPSVWVIADTDLELAQELVLALSRGQSFAESQSSSWCCPKCREQIEAQFTECWRCGASQPA